MADVRERFTRGEEVRGFAYPLTKGKEGYFPRRNSDAIRRSSIINILFTLPGERVMEPDFGSRVFFLLFEPNDVLLHQALVEETRGALQRWDPFIEVRGVLPEADGDTIRLFIDYVDTRSKNPEEQRITFSLRRS